MYINRLITYRILWLSIWALVLLGFSAVLISRLLSDAPLIDNSVGVWFQSDDIELVRYQNYNQAFGEQEWTLLMLQTASIYDPEFLDSLSDITHQLEQLPHVVKVTSITNVRDNFITAEEGLEYRTIFPHKKDASVMISPQKIQEMRRNLLANPIFQNNLILKGNDYFTVVLIQNDNLIHDPSPYRMDLVDNINRILDKNTHIINYSLAGTTVVNAELNRAAKHDVYIYYTLISLLLIVFGWLNFHNIRDLLVMFAVILGGVLPSMGLIALMDIPYNMITVMLPTILVSLAVAGVVHVINEYHAQHRNKLPDAALRYTIQQLWKPCLYTALTTIFGFLSLTVSTVEPVFQLGLYAAIGILFAWITSVTIAPLLLTLLWTQPKSSLQKDFPISSTSNQPPPWLNNNGVKLVVLALLCIPVFGLGKLETDTNYMRFFDDSVPVTNAYKNIKNAGFAQNPVNIVIEYPTGRYFSDAQYFSSVLDFEQKLSELPQVIKILSANELLRQIDKAFNAEHTTPAQFHKYSPAQIDQLLFLAELSGNDDVDDVLLKNKTKTQLIALTPYMSSKELDVFRARVQNIARNTLPRELNIYVTGTTVLWANMDEQVSATQLYSLAGISLFLLFLFIGIFRSYRLVGVALLVNAIPLAITLGIMGIVGIKINIATALIGGITLGVVVDDTIHLFSRIKYYLEKNQSMSAAIDNAIRHVGKSIVNTTVIITGGFACLATSSFLPSAQFGIFVTMAITIALILDLYIAPALLNMLYRNKETGNANSTSELLNKEKLATEQNPG